MVCQPNGANGPPSAQYVFWKARRERDCLVGVYPSSGLNLDPPSAPLRPRELLFQREVYTTPFFYISYYFFSVTICGNVVIATLVDQYISDEDESAGAVCNLVPGGLKHK